MAVLASHANKMQGDAHVESGYFKSDRSLDWLIWSNGWIEHSVILAGNKQVALAVSSGELDWGLTDTDDAIIEKESGQPVEIVFPDQGESDFGTLFIPNTISVLQKAPSPTAAALLADFLVSEKSESRLTMGNSAQFPVWPDAKIKSRLVGTKVPRWANVDFEIAAEGWAKTMESLKQRLDASLGR